MAQGRRPSTLIPPVPMNDFSWGRKAPASQEASVEDPSLVDLQPGVGLLSEQLSKEYFPRLLTVGDLTVLAGMLILYVTNISVVTLAGAAALIFWLLGFVAFLIPQAIITSKLARMFPGEGAFYLWVYKGLGPFWDSLLGFFSLWWPPVLLIIAAGAAVASFLQGLGGLLGQTWLVEPWQQGIVVLGVLGLAWLFARMPLSITRHLMRWTLFSYLGLLGTMALATGIWLLLGHLPQTDFHVAQWAPNSGNITFFSTVILACLGIQIPLNMGGEVRKSSPLHGYLPRSVLLVIVGYLVAWIVLAVVLPQDPTNPLSAANPSSIGLVFAAIVGNATLGKLLSALSVFILCLFYIVSSGAYSLVQSRLIVMSALDRRLPLRLSTIDTAGVPRAAINMQMVILVGATLAMFIVVPLIIPEGATFETILYTLLSASAVVLWAISALALFVVGVVIVRREKARALQVGGAPSGVIVLAALLGILATVASLWLVFTGPWIPLLTTDAWFFWVALLVLASLAVGAVYSFLVPDPADIWDLLSRQVRGEASSRRTETR
jgi:amino acid transporter